jgi:hypothetical protein
LQAVTIASSGVPEAPHTLEALPGSSAREFASAIDNDGDWLIATTPTTSGGPVWLHAYSPRCAYQQRRVPLKGARTSSSDPRMTLIAGPHGVFHLTSVAPHEQLKIATVHVRCRPSTKPPRRPRAALDRPR